MRAVHVVVPNDIDDPATPSGGNAYDRRLCEGLAAFGWQVHEHAVHGGWPVPAPAARVELAKVLASLPDAAIVLIDGLIASAVPDVLRPARERLAIVVLVHMPLGDLAIEQRAPEGETLSAATAVITTSEWTRDRLLDVYALAPERIHVAAPGVEAAPLAVGTTGGTELLCVAALTWQKGYDVLVDALARLAGERWNCACVGALDREPAFVAGLRATIDGTGLGDRVRVHGPRTGTALDAEYTNADLLVLASRAETYGMVVTEALSRGVPVVASAVGGLPEAIGRAPDGSLPGLLVPPGDADALTSALRLWLTDSDLRDGLRRSARDRRATLTGWTVTADRISTVLAGATVAGALR